MCCHFRANRRRIAASDDIQRARRQAGALGNHAQRQRRQWGLDCRFAHHRAARCQSRAQLATEHGRREIPRRDRRHHTHRLVQREDAIAAGVAGNRVAVHALGLFAKPFQKASRIQHLALRLRKRLALLGGHQHGQIILMMQHQVEHAAQHVRALPGGHVCPRRERRMRGIDGTPGFIRTHVWHRAQQRACGGVAYFAGTAGRGRTPLARNQCLVAQQLRIGQWQCGHHIFSMHGFILYSASSTGFLR